MHAKTMLLRGSYMTHAEAVVIAEAIAKLPNLVVASSEAEGAISS